MLREYGSKDTAPDPMPSSALALVTDRGGNNCRPPVNGALVPASCYQKSNEHLDLSECNNLNNCEIKNGDTLELSNDLVQAAEQCQLIAERLKRKGDMQKKSDEDGKSENICCQKYILQERKTTADNIRLRQVNNDVTDINKRWQKYNRQQQDYIQRLLASNRSLQQEKEKAEEDAAAILVSEKEKKSRKPQIPLSFRHSDSSLMDNSTVITQLRQSYESAVKENCRLQKELEEVLAREESLKQRVLRLQENHQEVLQLLNMQIKAHKEDWEAEKTEKDNERTINRRLQDQLETANYKCRSYSERINAFERASQYGFGVGDEVEGWRMLRRHRSASPTGHNFVNVVVDGNSHSHSEPQLIPRGYSEECNSQQQQPVTAQPSPSAPATNSSLEMFELNDSNTVTCPGCQKHFTSDQHLNFLSHFETCQTE